LLDQTGRRRQRALVAVICLVCLGGVVAWIVANAYDPPPRLWACTGAAVTNSSEPSPTRALTAYLRETRGENEGEWKLVEKLKGSAAFEKRDGSISHTRIEVDEIGSGVWRVGGSCRR
jgi:hypothetical protein